MHRVRDGVVALKSDDRKREHAQLGAQDAEKSCRLLKKLFYFLTFDKVF